MFVKFGFLIGFGGGFIVEVIRLKREKVKGGLFLLFLIIL